MNKKNLSALIAASVALASVTLAAASMTKAENPATTGHDMSTGMSKDAKPYVAYSKAAFDAAKGTQRVLFFHATWCPNCKRADADITKNLGQLPKNVTIFKTDYDKEAALKKAYGITSQHSFVLVDAQGKALKKWSGGGMKEIVAATAKKM